MRRTGAAALIRGRRLLTIPLHVRRLIEGGAYSGAALIRVNTVMVMMPIQDIVVLVLAFALGLTVGLMLCYLIFRKSTDLVVQQRPNQPVEQPATPARRRQCQQRIGRKQPTEHDECLLWVSSETAEFRIFSVTCGRFAICF